MSDREKFRAGAELLSKGRFSEGLALFEAVLEQDPVNVPAASGGVFALMALQREGDAFRLAEQVSKRSSRPEAKSILAGLLRRVGKIDEAEAAFRAILDTSPDNHSALYGMGLTALYTDLDLAECYANRLEVLAPNSFSAARLRLGILAKRTPAELPAAAKAFVRQFDGHLDARSEAATLLVINRLPEDALELLSDQLMQPFRGVDPRAVRRLMQAAIKTKRWPVAARAGAELCRGEAPQVVDFFGRGYASYHLSDWSAAKSAFSQCLEKEPTHKSAALLYYRSCLRSKDLENIQVAARRVTELKPDEPGPYRFLLLDALRQYRFVEAFHHWRTMWRLKWKGATEPG